MTTAARAQTMMDYEFFLAGQAIFKTDDRDDKIYVVIEGEVAIWLNDNLIGTLKPGEFLVNKTLPRAASVTAIAYTNCQLVAIDEVMLTSLTRYSPDFIVQIVRVMVERLPHRVSPQIKWRVTPQSMGAEVEHRWSHISS